MIYQTGETVRFLRFTSSSPEAARFQLVDEDGSAVMRQLTVENGGLEQRRKGALVPVFTAPLVPGRYSWRFTDGARVESGHVRVVAASPARVDVEPAPEREGVRARRL